MKQPLPMQILLYHQSDIYSHKFLKLIWFLTPTGRIQARHEYGQGSSLYTDDADFDIPQIKIDITKMQMDIKYFIEKPKERIDTIKEAKFKKNINGIYDDADFSEVDKENIEFDQADVGLPNQETYNSTLEDIEN